MKARFWLFMHEFVVGVHPGGYRDHWKPDVVRRTDVGGCVTEDAHARGGAVEIACMCDCSLEDIGSAFVLVAPTGEVEEIEQTGALQL
jgi:hypothetical protein